MSSETIKAFFKHYRWHEIIRSLLTALIFATVVILPFIVLFVNMLLLWFWRINLFGILFGLSLGAWAVLVMIWFYDTLIRYQEVPLTTLKPSPLMQGVIFGAILFVVTMIVTLFIVPIYL